MVGPGTGIAPFRAFIQERAENSQNYLVFGCRHELKDYYYKEEWGSYGENLKVFTAFSRDGEDKKYV